MVGEAKSNEAGGDCKVVSCGGRLAMLEKSQQPQLLFVRDWKNSDDEERVGGPTVEFLGRAEKEMQIGFQELAVNFAA